LVFVAVASIALAFYYRRRNAKMIQANGGCVGDLRLFTY
jgi:hypothetical protein